MATFFKKNCTEKRKQRKTIEILFFAVVLFSFLFFLLLVCLRTLCAWSELAEVKLALNMRDCVVNTFLHVAIVLGTQEQEEEHERHDVREVQHIHKTEPSIAVC